MTDERIYHKNLGMGHVQDERGIVYTFIESVTNRFRNPKPVVVLSCPSPDGYKTRAARLLGDGLKAYYSHRRGYVVSPTKFAKFEKMYAEGWDASVITGELYPPNPSSVA